MIVENEQFVFVVTHVEAENQYLKIWAQTDERVVQSVAGMLTTLQDKFEYSVPLHPPSPSNLMPNTRCCARGISNEYSRAKVISVRPDGNVLVQFVDYGNITYVPIHNIRLLDGLPEAEYLFAVPDAASVFALAEVVPIGGTWLDDIVKKIHSILVNNKYCGVYQSVNNCKFLSFNMMKEDFGKILVTRNMAMYSNPSSMNRLPQPMPMPIQPIRPVHEPSNVSHENWKMTQNNAPVQKVTKNNSFKAIQLEIGSVHNVRVSYVDEGPRKFSVQLIESIPYLNVMMEKINSMSHLPLQESPIAGTVCLGQQTYPQRLCRVVLNSPGDNSCKVYYADYGHHEVLPFTSLYQIPDEFVTPNIFSIRFTLNGTTDWKLTQDMKDYFGGLVNDKPLKLRVCKGPMSPLTQYCDLFLNRESIKDMLIETFPQNIQIFYPEPKRLQNGSREIGFVSFVDSIAKFFIQLDREVKILDNIMEQVEQVSRTAPKLNKGQLCTNMPCIALYDIDKKWYRASIVGTIDPEKLLVFYVDFGNEEIVSFDNLRMIPSQLVENFPKLAIKCCLNGFQFKHADQELTKNFESLVLDERLCLEVLNYHEDTVMVNLYDNENASDLSRANIIKKLQVPGNLREPEPPKPNNHNQWNNDPSSKPAPMRNQRSDAKPSAQKPRAKNKNTKTRDNGSWEKDAGQSQSKFRKDNENEQRLDNRFRKSNSDAPQNNHFDSGRNERFNQTDKYNRNSDGSSGSKGYSNNDRFNRSFDSNDSNGKKPMNDNQMNRPQISMNSRLDRSFGSDKDSDTSSRSGSRRSSRSGKRSGDDQRKRDVPANNRNRIGRWENGQEQDTPRNNYNDQSANSVRPKPAPKENRVPSIPNPDKPKVVAIPKIPSPNITVGAIKNCIMVYYTNPSSFYVQLCPDNEELNAVMDKIHSLYETGGKVVQASEIKEGLQYLAQYSLDNEWYRAVVNSVEPSAATVLFIDYGNIEKVAFDRIKEMMPELAKLPAQAIHCQLFCPSKTTWSKDESDLLANETDEKTLEAEFVAEQSGKYSILMKIVGNEDASKYVNELFTDGAELAREKESLRNKTRPTVQRVPQPLDYASLDTKWSNNQIEFGTTYDVHIAWFPNPENFYCQLASQQNEFRAMMNEIQIAYTKRQPVSEPLKIGSSVIAVLPDDGVLYRAQILELNKPKGHVVQYVDYGDSAMVDPRKIYPVEKKYMKLPKQAIACGLKNIAPVTGSNWTNSAEIAKIFDEEKFDSVFHELQEDKYLISLNSKGEDVGRVLVDKGFAVYSSVTMSEKAESLAGDAPELQEISKIDTSLLEGQTLHVKVSSVEGVGKFFVQFYTAEACQEVVDKFMKVPSQVLPGLSCHEVCVGAGCLVKCKGKWRRGVVVNIVKPNYEVRLIDTGENERVPLNSMLKLPAPLAVVQKQAIECSLFDVPLSTKANETLKKLVLGKDVKIFIEKIEANRLVVRLFDLNGNKIKVVDTQNTEKIAPVCNMEILSSTHDVTVTWVNSCQSIWLQRTSESAIEGDLLEKLYEFYSTNEEKVTPIKDEYYAALSSDGNWYRVKALEVNDSKVTVMFLDYGNVEIVPANDVRKLEPQFYSPPQLGIEVSLTVSLSGDKPSQLEILQPLLESKVFSATFYNVNRKWLVELTEDGEKISEKLKSLDVVNETTKTEFAFEDLADMLVGEKYPVIVSHIDTPNQLWIQRAEATDALAELQSQLQETAATCPDIEGVPEEKSLCLALYSLDSAWYRAEVLDADADITTVRFVDYGNTDVVDNNAGRIKRLSDKWRAPSNYSVQCKLDILPASCGPDEWTEEACVRLKKLVLVDNPLKALIVTDKAPMRIDLFQENGLSVCETLVEERFASYVQSSDDLEEELLGHEEEDDERQFDPRSAFVSNIVSVDEFWVQEEKWTKDLEMIEDRLLMASILSPLEKIEPGLACVAHFPGDGQFYRAKVLSHSDEGTKVHYVDYGNSALTKDVRAIPQDLDDIPALSRKCRLAKPDGVESWPSNINEEFKKLSADGQTVYLLDVIDEGESCLVRLTHEGKDAAMELLEMCRKSSAQTDDEGIVVHDAKDIATKERPAPLGEENDSDDDVCIVSSAISPSEFWIQKKNQIVELGDLTKKVGEVVHPTSIADVQVDKILAVKYDESYYRCKVTSRTDAEINVFFIDFGTVATINESELFELPPDLSCKPAMATRCSLKMPETLDSWPKIATDKFNELVADGMTDFRFQILDENSDSEVELVALFYKNQNIVNILLGLEDSTLNGHPSEELDSRNSSSDSAIQSETDPGIIEANNRNLTEPIDATLIIDEVRTPVDQETKIVPGCISRGISVDEIARFSPVHRTSSPEEKIVPGSINKGDVEPQILDLHETEGLETPPIDLVETKNFVFSEDTRVEESIKILPVISHDERLVPSCVSRGETPPIDRPMTPKTEHSEKLVSGAVNAQVVLNYEDDEIITVEIDKDIPEA